MSSLQISGWNDNDCRVELEDIVQHFHTLKIKEMESFDHEEIHSSLAQASLIYLSKGVSKETKKLAFLAAERLEYIQHLGFSYARSKISESLKEEEDSIDDFDFVHNEILGYFENLIDKKGFEFCLFSEPVWTTKHGNYIFFSNFKIYSFDKELSAAFLLANQILDFPYDFLTGAASALFYYNSISEWLTDIADKNYHENLTNAMKDKEGVSKFLPKEVSIGSRFLHSDIKELIFN